MINHKSSDESNDTMLGRARLVLEVWGGRGQEGGAGGARREESEEGKGFVRKRQ